MEYQPYFVGICVNFCEMDKETVFSRHIHQPAVHQNDVLNLAIIIYARDMKRPADELKVWFSAVNEDRYEKFTWNNPQSEITVVIQSSVISE